MLSSGVACLDGNWGAKGASGRTAVRGSAWALFCALERRSVAESVTATLPAVAAGAERRSAAVAVTSVCVALGGSVLEFVRSKVAGSSNGQVSCFPYTVSTLSAIRTFSWSGLSLS